VRHVKLEHAADEDCLNLWLFFLFFLRPLNFLSFLSILLLVLFFPPFFLLFFLNFLLFLFFFLFLLLFPTLFLFPFFLFFSLFFVVGFFLFFTLLSFFPLPFLLLLFPIFFFFSLFSSSPVARFMMERTPSRAAAKKEDGRLSIWLPLSPPQGEAAPDMARSMPRSMAPLKRKVAMLGSLPTAMPSWIATMLSLPSDSDE